MFQINVDFSSAVMNESTLYQPSEQNGLIAYDIFSFVKCSEGAETFLTESNWK